MVTFNPEFYLPPLGSEGNSSIYIKDSTGIWQEFTNFEYFKIIRKQNQISQFEIKFYDIEGTDKLFVKEFSEVLFFSEQNLILKGRIQKPIYSTAYEANVKGFGIEANILDEEFLQKDNTSAVWTDAKRAQYTNIPAQTIIKELLSDNSDGNSPYIVTPATDGIFSTDYGLLSMRFEYANRLNAIAKVAEALEYEWDITQELLNPPYTDSFKFAKLLPTTTRATVSQETFSITGANPNCSQTNKETDITNLANKIDALGAGDGVNQVHTSVYNASATYSILASDITAASTTITLADASAFASSGEIRIMEERVTYAGKSGNDLTGCVRGANSTIARIHKKNIFIEKYVDIESAESGSSIYYVKQQKQKGDGVMDYTVIHTDILDLPTLELIASRKLLEKKDPIIRITVIPDDPLETVGNRKIGDLITVVDSEADISDDYRVVELHYVSNFGDIELEMIASNKSLTFIQQMQSQKEEQDNLQKYTQGSTNIYAVNLRENCDVSNYFNVRLFIPNEAIALNLVSLNFKLEAYRVYTGDISGSGGHIHSITVNNEVGGSGSLPLVGISSNALYSAYGATGGSVGTTSTTHSHTVPSGINDIPLVSPSVDLYTGEDGGTMTFKQTYTTDQTEVNLTAEAAAVGVGKWFNIQFRPNKEMRIDTNTYIQIFIESK